MSMAAIGWDTFFELLQFCIDKASSFLTFQKLERKAVAARYFLLLQGLNVHLNLKILFCLLDLHPVLIQMDFLS